MKFDYDYLMELADCFDKKAEQLLETAQSIRETAGIMSPGRTKETPPQTIANTPAPKTPQKTQAESLLPDDEPPKFTRLESLIMDSLQNKPAGEKMEQILQHCNTYGNMGTQSSIEVTLGKMVKKGHLARLGSKCYAINTAFYGQVAAETEPTQWS